LLVVDSNDFELESGTGCCCFVVVLGAVVLDAVVLGAVVLDAVVRDVVVQVVLVRHCHILVELLDLLHHFDHSMPNSHPQKTNHQHWERALVDQIDFAFQICHQFHRFLHPQRQMGPF